MCRPQVKAALTRAPDTPAEVPIVTGFLARGMQTSAITTLGRGGSDLSATVLGAAMELSEVQVRGCQHALGVRGEPG
jgi:aspartate kinase